MYTQRKGIALFITLSVIATIIALVGVVFVYLDEAREDAGKTTALVQGNLYYADIIELFNKFKDKKDLFTTLYLSPVPLVSEDGRFSMMLSCRPLANGININWLGLEYDPKMLLQYNTATDIFDVIVENYSLKDGERLKEMLLEEIGGKERFIPQKQSRLYQKKGIISYRQFEAILSRYRFEVDDPKAGRVPWKKFFAFSPTAEKIDGAYISPELIALMFNIDIALAKEEWIEGETNLKTFVQNSGTEEYNPKLFVKEKAFLEHVECEVSYAYNEERFNFRFVDIEGDVKDFEFDGKQ